MYDQTLYEYFLTDNKSGWKCVPKKLEKNNPELYNKITVFLSNSKIPDTVKFKQKVWHFLNNQTDVVTCKECGGPGKFLDIRRGYQEFCSVTCSNKNLEKIETTKKNNIEKWGTPTPFQNKDVYDGYIKKLKEEYGVINQGQLKSVKEKISKTNLERYGYNSPFSNKEHRVKWNQKTSGVELNVVKCLNCEHKHFLDNKEFDIKCGDYIIEVDSDYHHPKILKNLSLIQVSSVINDYEKTIICEKHGLNLLRINTSKCNKIEDIDLDYIKNNSYEQDFTLNYGDVILNKEYLTKYIQVNGKDKLLRYVPLLLKFIRTFQKEFPKITTDEDIDLVIKKIRGNKKLGYDIKDGFVYFNNNTSNVGVSLLKSNFDNYWLSCYKGNKSPVELWFDDGFMMKIIKYRIGLNESGEVFDFSLKNILKGFSSNRVTISFFKPLLASNIYKHYLGDIKKPVVFDPCFGFGGRLLGFKSTYPDGEYIGIDPDVNGYKNMLRLSDCVGGVNLHNTKLEDFDIKCFDYDIAFTSIPYYDLETYSDNVTYQNFEDWKNTFIHKLLKLPRLLVNMSYKLCEELNLTEYIDSFIESNTSHFNKKTNKKLEVIVKLNF